MHGKQYRPQQVVAFCSPLRHDSPFQETLKTFGGSNHYSHMGHITDLDLERFHLGMMAETELVILEEHLLTCPPKECRTILLDPGVPALLALTPNANKITLKPEAETEIIPILERKGPR
jgi:hypothetical protein